MSPTTEAESRDFAVTIRAHYHQPSIQMAAALADHSITRLGGGANNAVFLCRRSDRTCCMKIYRTDGRARDEREWLALHLLADRCPGLAPRPIWRNTDSTLPMIAMEPLPGHPLRDMPLGPSELGALANAFRSLGAITPANASFPHRSAGAAPELLARVEHWLADTGQPHADTHPSLPVVRAMARSRLADGERDLLLAPAAIGFSRGDPNLANCLWDAADGRVRLIDFEYAGWGDLAGDLADLIEGPWARQVPDATWHNFAHGLGLRDRASERRFAAARRVCATFWVMKFAEQLARTPTEAQYSTLARQLARAQHLLEGPA